MSTYRGLDGGVSLGGIVQGAPLVQGAVAASATSMTIDGSPLTGVVIPGDTFTVSGDATVYTVVTGGAIASNALALTFSPGSTAGFADNAAVTFAANSMGEIKSWTLSATRDLLEDTAMGDASKTYKAGLNQMSGTVGCHLDYGDAEQAEFIDDVVASGAATLGLTLIASDGKQFWGQVAASGFNVSSDLTAIVGVSFNWQSSTPFAIDWN